ncbi:hypothetical protein POI8812_02705 [Pontivivens insulae]|uniref:Lipoprotein n=2 Tax=Pontivivens insulae TaxID=1639689 RepID=A0A2R8ADS4_9RHOB|nr:hypothetical protein DFR53_1649 [Pontivivens insulae]SPF30369.1 hypothetical protein POI8812_02705 [Pontivivens insulae]
MRFVSICLVAVTLLAACSQRPLGVLRHDGAEFTIQQIQLQLVEGGTVFRLVVTSDDVENDVLTASYAQAFCEAFWASEFARSASLEAENYRVLQIRLRSGWSVGFVHAYTFAQYGVPIDNGECLNLDLLGGEADDA